MNLPVKIPPLSADDYLTGEPLSDIRHEYVAGEVYAMAGAGERHNRISLNIAFHVRAATRGTHCAAFMSDMKVRVAAADAFYYPDALLTCDSGDDAPLYKVAPCLIAEVLSPSTEVIDPDNIGHSLRIDPLHPLCHPSHHEQAPRSYSGGPPCPTPALPW